MFLEMFALKEKVLRCGNATSPLHGPITFHVEQYGSSLSSLPGTVTDGGLQPPFSMICASQPHYGSHML